MTTVALVRGKRKKKNTIIIIKDYGKNLIANYNTSWWAKKKKKKYFLQNITPFSLVLYQMLTRHDPSLR